MNDIIKTQISRELKAYCDKAGSQNKAATKLGTSSATISQMLAGKWDLIKDDLWRYIGKGIGYSQRKWPVVETKNYKMLKALYTDAKKHSVVYAVVGDAGSGKTLSANEYSRLSQNVFVVECREYWTRKKFLSELLRRMGKNFSGTISEMMDEIMEALKRMDSPLIILDEIDKVKDPVLYFLITFYNELEDHCGIVLQATSYFKKRMLKGVRLSRKGYHELYSRLGRKFISLSAPRSNDIIHICSANGVTDKAKIKEIIEESDNDLRRVKRKIHALKVA